MKSLQFYTCLIRKAGSNYIQTPAKLLLVVLYTKFRMVSQHLIAYASKRLPEAAKNYSITLLEICSLAINITSLAHLLKRVDFDAVDRPFSINPHNEKQSGEPTTTRIKRLLEVLSSYSFNMYYIKGKDMVLSDYFVKTESR